MTIGRSSSLLYSTNNRTSVPNRSSSTVSARLSNSVPYKKLFKTIKRIVLLFNDMASGTSVVFFKKVKHTCLRISVSTSKNVALVCGSSWYPNPMECIRPLSMFALNMFDIACTVLSRNLMKCGASEPFKPGFCFSSITV